MGRLLYQIAIVYFFIMTFIIFPNSAQNLIVITLNENQLPDLGNANGTTYDRNEKLKEVLDHIGRPDILLINSFSTTFGVNAFLDNVLNVDGIVNYDYEFYESQMPGHNWNAAVFYDTSTVIFDSRFDFEPQLYFRSISRLDFFVRDSINNLASLHIYTNHSGSCFFDAPVCFRERYLLMQRLDTILSMESPNANYIVSGGFGFYGNSDSSYQYITQNGMNPLVDPLAVNGDWYLDSTYSHLWTGSTRNSGFDNSVNTFGMSMRTSINLFSPSLINGSQGLHYVPNSYKVIGNDGLRGLGEKIIEGQANAELPPNIVDALYHFNEELPIQFELDFGPLVNLSDNSSAYEPTIKLDKNKLSIISKKELENFEVVLYTIQGKILYQKELNSVKAGNTYLPLESQISNGFYILKSSYSKGPIRSSKHLISE